MPNRWPISSGNWSNAAIWSGSLIPTASDDVFANNFTVNVDTSFQVLSLRSTSTTGVTAGGSFTFSSGSISGSVTAATPIVTFGNQPNLIITATEGTVTLIFSPGASLAQGGNCITYSGNCNLTIQGNPNIGGPNTANGGSTINKSSAGTLIITGSLLGSSTSGFSGARALIISTNSSNTIISGSLIGALVGGTGHLVIEQSVGNLTIIGPVTAGSITGGHAISATTPGTITITGSVTGASGAGTGNAILCSSAATINISGSVYATTASSAVVSTNASSVVILNGNIYNSGSRQALYCPNLFISDIGTTQAQFFTSGSLQDRTLYASSVFPTLPSASNVRSTISYGPGNELTGTLRMPNAADVRSGVLTDNTTGSALLITQTLLNEITASTNPIALRLENISTADTMGQSLAAFKKGGS